ncbi:UbiA family prenyltransferase [Umezawaea sp. Da 62-37]|uniref:UbiA family prenyltransferase n=1 Tax=Umezawaea sp. Da 62-37 TaxID=3075927 RepID=UPI0028F6EE32|nr:UbiA family prenyltransferase [Umezawaea sp. Da 62-37]WNV87209.1 UbiA family prenyltransferase [Umezawaea sp. Da 62-37]
MSTLPLPAPTTPEPMTALPGRGPLRALVALVRPYQWIKNLVLLPLPLLHPQVWNATGVLHLLGALAVFTVASSIVYIGNDIADRDRDRRHPIKRNRPLAAGQLTVSTAVVFGIVLLAVLAALIALVEPLLAAPVLGYLALNAAYSYGLKHVPVVEVFAVAVGFGLRLIAGYVAVHLDTSWWPTMGVFLLSVVVVLGKRRQELGLPDQAHRPALRGYTKGFLDQLVVLSAALAVTTLLFFLATYEFPFGVQVMPLILPLTLLGLFRYLQIVSVSGGGGDPVRILVRDRIILVSGALSAVIWLVLQLVVHDWL